MVIAPASSKMAQVQFSKARGWPTLPPLHGLDEPQGHDSPPMEG